MLVSIPLAEETEPGEQHGNKAVFRGLRNSFTCYSLFTNNGIGVQ